MVSAFMREIKVVGFISSSAAAPSWPYIFQPALTSAANRFCRSCCRNSRTVTKSVALGRSLFGKADRRQARLVRGQCQVETERPAARKNHGPFDDILKLADIPRPRYRRRASRCCRVMTAGGTPRRAEDALTKCAVSSGISSTRSRKGGR